MINFVNIEQEETFQEKYGIPAVCFGLEYSSNLAPIDFRYIAEEAVSTFKAYKVDSIGNILAEIDIETSLIDTEWVSGIFYHFCDGLTDFITELPEGTYYFLVNDKYQSEYFNAVEGIPTSVTDTDISVSGLDFYEIGVDLDYPERQGEPYVYYGNEFASNTRALDFRYVANEAITSFKAVKIDSLYNILEEIDLDTSLVTNSGGYHYSSSEILNNVLNIGTYYFVVNNKFRSANFCIATLTCFLIDNITNTPATETKTTTIYFDAELVGLEFWLPVELIFTFSCGLETITNTYYLGKNAKNFSIDVDIPFGVNGLCNLVISSTLCEKTYSYDFLIEAIGECCFDLEDGSTLELEDGTCLQPENCEVLCFEFVSGDIFELITGECLETVN